MQNRRSRKELCSHNVYIKGLCGNCGARLDPPQSSSVSMIHSIPELKVSEEYAKEIGKADQERLIQERKLVLLVDLDQTILHTTHESVQDDPNVHSFRLWPGHPIYYTKLRPYLAEFLDHMSKIYELHIFTFGCRIYAHKIASIIDPKQVYFGNRILSRDDSVDQYSKKGNLNNLFPCGDAMVCIIDDRSDVWRDADNLIQVKPYSYFKTSISDGALAQMNAQALAEDENQLDRDVDELEALLGVNNDRGGEEETSGAPEGGTLSPEKQEDGDEKVEQPEDSRQSSSTENEIVGQDEEEKEEEMKETDGRIVKRSSEQEEELEKRIKLDGQLSKGKEMIDVCERVTDETGAEKPDEEAPKTDVCPNARQSSASIPDDTDDHLLKMQTILSRIHEKWYIELDAQREFLMAGENYKLPDIKDIIARYLRKSYH